MSMILCDMETSVARLGEISQFGGIWGVDWELIFAFGEFPKPHILGELEPWAKMFKICLIKETKTAKK